MYYTGFSKKNARIFFALLVVSGIQHTYFKKISNIIIYLLPISKIVKNAS